MRAEVGKYKKFSNLEARTFHFLEYKKNVFGENINFLGKNFEAGPESVPGSPI